MTEHDRNRAMRQPPPKPAAGKPASAGETAASPEKQFDPSKFAATSIPHEHHLELLQMKRPIAPRSRLYGYGSIAPGGEQRGQDADEVLDSLLADETSKPVASAEAQRAAEGHVNTLTGLPAPPPNAQPELAYTSPSGFNEHRTMLGLSASPASALADTELPQSSAPTQPSRAAARARQHRRLAILGLLVLCGGGMSAGLLFNGTPRQAPQRTVSAARSSASSVPRIVSVPAIARVVARNTSAASSSTPTTGGATTTSPRVPTQVSHAKNRAQNGTPAGPPAAASSPSPNDETESKSWINVRD